MKHGFIKAAAVMPKIKVAEVEYNGERIREKITEAVEKGSKIIVFPELCITGYTCEDLFFQELLLKKAKEELKKIAAFTENMDALIFVGLPIEREHKLYNVAAAIQGGEVCAFIPKRYIPNYGEFYEARHFTPGNETVTEIYFDGEMVPFGTNILFDCETVEGMAVACEICEDVWVANPPSTRHALAGANVIVNLSASNATVSKDTYRSGLVTSASARLISAYIYASAGEGESTQDLVFDGHSLIAENGTVLAEAERFLGKTIYADIDIQKLCMERRRMNTFMPEETGEYLLIPFSLKEEETKLLRKFDTAPFVPADQSTRDKRCSEILSMQAYGLKKRYEHTGAKTAVLGISGGLDSTLALLVTVKAFDMLGKDRKDILSITMPGFGTTDRTYDNACKLAKTLGTSLQEVSIKEAVTVHFKDIGQSLEVHDVTYENGQARERTQILMDMANKTGGMVIGTGDMSELALGWATYNGDHMSMYGVNVGVPKTLVRHLVQFYADTCKEKELSEVLTDVLATPVSPELLPPVDGVISQRTEDLVGPYELHDFFLYYMLRQGFAPEKIYRIACLSFQGLYGKETILKWLKVFYRRFFSQQFKRSCLPDGPKVGSVSLSPRGDWRMPSDACAAIWLKELEKL